MTKIAEKVIEPKGDTSIPSLAITEPRHIVKAAATLFNRYQRIWGKGATPQQVQVLNNLLLTARLTLMDCDIAARLRNVEDRLGASDGGSAPQAGNGANGHTPIN